MHSFKTRNDIGLCFTRGREEDDKAIVLHFEFSIATTLITCIINYLDKFHERTRIFQKLTYYDDMCENYVKMRDIYVEMQDI